MIAALALKYTGCREKSDIAEPLCYIYDRCIEMRGLNLNLAVPEQSQSALLDRIYLRMVY